MIFNKLSITALLFSAGVMAQVPGTSISYSITTDKNASGTMIVYSQNGNSRVEMDFKVAGSPIPSFKITTLVQADKPNTTIQLNEANKTYTETVAADSKQPAENKENKEYTVTVLGKEKVGEYNCTHVKVKNDKTEYEMWVTKDITPSQEYYKSDNKYAGNAELYKALEAKQAGGFPVKVVHNQAGSGEGVVTMILTKFERMNVPFDKFQIPIGYAKASSVMPYGMPGQQEIMNMTPEERQKFIEEMKKQYGGKSGN